MPERSVGALTGPRLLSQPIEEYIGTYTDGVGLPDYKQWQVVPGHTNAVYNEQYLDIDAYQMDQLTLVPGSISVQLTDLNPGTALVQADDQSLIASGSLSVDVANNIASHSSDLYPDNFGPTALSEAFIKM